MSNEGCFPSYVVIRTVLLIPVPILENVFDQINKPQNLIIIHTSIRLSKSMANIAPGSTASVRTSGLKDYRSCLNTCVT